MGSVPPTSVPGTGDLGANQGSFPWRWVFGWCWYCSWFRVMPPCTLLSLGVDVVNDGTGHGAGGMCPALRRRASRAFNFPFKDSSQGFSVAGFVCTSIRPHPFPPPIAPKPLPRHLGTSTAPSPARLPKASLPSPSEKDEQRPRPASFPPCILFPFPQSLFLLSCPLVVPDLPWQIPFGIKMFLGARR